MISRRKTGRSWKTTWVYKLRYFDNTALFEYHDEPFAASSKLDNKVPDNIIRKRFTETRQLVNRQLLDRENNRKWKEEIWYIMDIETTKYWNNETLLVIRPSLHAPEIDSYDDIKLNQITWVFEDKKLEIGDKIIYKV